MENLDKRAAALCAPGRGTTEEDRAKMKMEMTLFMREFDTLFLKSKQVHIIERDFKSVAGKLATEFDALAVDANATDAQKTDYIQRVTGAIDDAEAEALAFTSGDLISQLYRSLVQGVKALMFFIKPPYCAQTLDFASAKRSSVCHLVDMSIMTLEDAARVRQFPAVPVPLNTFSQEQIDKHGEHFYTAELKPYLDQLLAMGPCEWRCVQDVSDKGVKAAPAPGLVCNLNGHKDCLFIKVVQHEGSDAFDFCYGKDN